MKMKSLSLNDTMKNWHYAVHAFCVCVCITVSLSNQLSHCTVVHWEVTEVLLAVTLTGGIEGSSRHLCVGLKSLNTLHPVKTHTGHPASTDGIYTRGEKKTLMSNPLWVKCNHFVFHAGWIWRYLLCNTWRKWYLLFFWLRFKSCSKN